MERRWPGVLAYVAAALVQAALLAGALVLHRQSQEHMMLMRFLYAKNLELEQVLFSPPSVRVQSFALAAVAAGLLFAGIRFGVTSRFAAVQCLVGSALAAAGSWLAFTQTTEDVYALYVTLAVIWVVLVVQAMVIAIASKSTTSQLSTSTASAESSAP